MWRKRGVSEEKKKKRGERKKRHRHQRRWQQRKQSKLSKRGINAKAAVIKAKYHGGEYGGNGENRNQKRLYMVAVA